MNSLQQGLGEIMDSVKKLSGSISCGRFFEPRMTRIERIFTDGNVGSALNHHPLLICVLREIRGQKISCVSLRLGGEICSFQR